jgi:trk system potassium uptake protein TrkH
VLFLALLPNVGGRSLFLLKAEITGPTPGKIVPRIADTAKILYGIYATMTLAQIICLLLAGLPLFHAVNVAFSTAATGGFTTTNTSIGGYNNASAEMIVAVFLLLFSVNFTV